VTKSFVVKEPGIYVLVFDNSFSINTSKRLTFSFKVSALGTAGEFPHRCRTQCFFFIFFLGDA
jgi:hypothetical protein